jgi:hypothetical protein
MLNEAQKKHAIKLIIRQMITCDKIARSNFIADVDQCSIASQIKLITKYVGSNKIDNFFELVRYLQSDCQDTTATRFLDQVVVLPNLFAALYDGYTIARTLYQDTLRVYPGDPINDCQIIAEHAVSDPFDWYIGIGTHLHYFSDPLGSDFNYPVKFHWNGSYLFLVSVK